MTETPTTLKPVSGKSLLTYLEDTKEYDHERGHFWIVFTPYEQRLVEPTPERGPVWALHFELSMYRWEILMGALGDLAKREEVTPTEILHRILCVRDEVRCHQPSDWVMYVAQQVLILYHELAPGRERKL
jgi:hypothetical protein